MGNIINEKIKLIFLVLLALISLSYALTDLNVDNIYFTGKLVQSSVEGGSLPSGTILMFNASCPSGWTEQTSYRGYFLRVDTVANVGATGGSITHTHTISGTTGSEASHTHGVGSYVGPSHTHGVGTLTAQHTHNVNPAGVSVSSGSSCGEGRGTSATQDLSGSAHGHIIDYPSQASAGIKDVVRSGTSGSTAPSISGSSAAGSSHSHGAGSLSGDSDSTLPPNIGVIYCKKD